MDYDLETKRVIEEIRKSKAKRVCLQFPDGLKPQATKIVQEIYLKLKAPNLSRAQMGPAEQNVPLGHSPKPQIYIWFSSNFGACDLPLHLKDLKFDLLVNYGHSKFKR